jgi:hypothetical protein
MPSKYFSATQLHVINRIGDIFLPGDGVLPRFSECGFVEHIDRMIAYIPPHDHDTLGRLLKILRFTPTFGIRALLKLTQLDRFFPRTIGSQLRKLDIGLRGIVFSLYYSFLDVPGGYGRRIKEAIRWDGDIRFKPAKADELPDLIQAAKPLGQV